MLKVKILFFVVAISIVFVVSVIDAEDYFTGDSLKDMLMELKTSSHEIIDSSRKITSKINRIQKRIPELHLKLEKIKKNRQKLLNGKEKIRAELKKEGKETNILREQMLKVQKEVKGLGQDQYRVEDQLSDNRKDLNRLKSQVSRLRKEIIFLQKKVQRPQGPMDSGIDDQSLKLKEEIYDQSALLQRKDSEYNRIEQDYEKATEELHYLQGISEELNTNLVILNQDMSSMQLEENHIKDRWSQLKQQDKDRFSKIHEEIDDLKIRNNELSSLIDKSIKVHDNVTTRFNAEKEDIHKTIQKLNEERESLLDQEKGLYEVYRQTKELLSQTQQIESIIPVIEQVRKKIELIKQREVGLNTTIIERKNEVDLARDYYRQLQKEVRLLGHDVEVSNKKTAQVLRKQERLLNRIEQDYEKSIEEFQYLQGVSEELDVNLVVLNKDMDSMQSEEDQIKDRWSQLEQQDKDRFSKIHSEISDLKTRENKLSSLINKSVKAHDNVTLRFNKEKESIYEFC